MAPEQRIRTLKVLLAAHLLLNPRWFIGEPIHSHLYLNIIFLGLLFSQSALWGFWCTGWPGDWLIKLVAVLTFLVCLTVSGLPLKVNGPVIYLFAILTAVVAALTARFARRNWRLALPDSMGNDAPDFGAAQFTLMHFLAATAIIAIL